VGVHDVIINKKTRKDFCDHHAVNSRKQKDAKGLFWCAGIIIVGNKKTRKDFVIMGHTTYDYERHGKNLSGAYHSVPDDTIT
jgi:hypothetical protein